MTENATHRLSPAERLRAAISNRPSNRSASGTKAYPGRTPLSILPRQLPAKPASAVAAPVTSIPSLAQPILRPPASITLPSPGVKVVVHLNVPKKPTPKFKRPKLDRALSALKALKLEDPRHILLCVPSDFSDCRAPIHSLRGLAEGVRGLFWLRRTGVVEARDDKRQLIDCTQFGSILDAPYPGYWSRVRELRVELADEDGVKLWMSVFGAGRVKGKDPHGFVLVEGELQRFGRALFITSCSEPPADVAGKVWVRYVCPGAPSEADVRGLINKALLDPTSFDAAAAYLVASGVLTEKQLLAVAEEACGQEYQSLREFFQILHQPESPDEGALAAEGARAMAVAGVCCAARVANIRPHHPRARIALPSQVIEDLIASQPETLTVDQVAAIQGLAKAMRSDRPLNGLLSGDVGTGKTLAFIVPAVAAHLQGAQVAIISPTEILANQVAANLARRFPGVKVERIFAGGKIKDPQAILIGTSGLSGVAKKVGYVPNLLVVDEQHKLATQDRDAMVGDWTHKLEASATPIPRSLAASLFAGTQVFNLTQAPVSRDIESFVLDESERGLAVAWMKEIMAGRDRAVVIYPRVIKGKVRAVASDAAAGAPPKLFEPGNDRPESKEAINSVLAASQALELRFPGRVGMLHGKVPTEELNESLGKFSQGVTQLAVASTIFETGIDIDGIRLMVVKGADNFGISQLHQLRGRLARNGGPGRFVMVVDDKKALAPETLDRLNTVRNISDGYALAEADMVSRGMGDLVGESQSGNVITAFRLLKLGLADFQN